MNKIPKRTFSFDEFQSKIKMSESIEEIGFKRYMDEFEENVDDLGEGEKVDTTDIKAEEEPPVEEPSSTPEPKDETETLSKPIDTGNKEDVTIDEINLKLGTVTNYLKILQNIVSSVDKVPLDKSTKEKILKLYNIVQNIS